jgi:hypothetical protein
MKDLMTPQGRLSVFARRNYMSNILYQGLNGWHGEYIKHAIEPDSIQSIKTVGKSFLCAVIMAAAFISLLSLGGLI